MGAHRSLILEVLEKSRVQMDGCTLRNLAAEELVHLGDDAFAEVEFVLRSEGGKGVPNSYHDLERRFPGIGAMWQAYFTMGAQRVEQVVVFLPTLNDAVLASAIPYIGVVWNGKEPMGEIPPRLIEFLATQLASSKHSGVSGAAKWLVKQRAPQALAPSRPSGPSAQSKPPAKAGAAAKAAATAPAPAAPAAPAPAPAKAPAPRDLLDPKPQSPKEAARRAIEEMVHRETRAWDAKDAAALVELFHPDMVWPWPPTPADHDPTTWVLVMGRYHKDRWMRAWQAHFDGHQLVHNRRELRKVVVTEQGDGGFAVVDIDTLWKDARGREDHWSGRVCKVYTRLREGGWKLIMHTGALAYLGEPSLLREP